MVGLGKGRAPVKLGALRRRNRGERARRACPLPTQWQEDAMDIVHDDYQVHYDAATATVICQGSFRLRGTEEYAPILQVLTAAADAQPALLTLDLRTLQFLNSS